MASAQIITSVDRSRGTAGDRSPIGVFDEDTDPLASNGVFEGGTHAAAAPVYSDRDYPFGVTPESMKGYEYVRTFNTDKDDDNHIMIYDVTIGEASILWMAVDDRWADVSSSGGVQEYLSQQEMVDLAAPGAAGLFVDTGMDLIVNEGSNQRPMSVYATLADQPAGTYRFGAMPIDKNFYIVGAIPEPMTLSLLGLGGLALVRRKRKM
jgi:hypothetical protein